LCNSHLLRELIAVTATGTSLDKTWAQQAIDALLALKDAAEAARQAGPAAIDQQVRAEHEDWFGEAAATGIAPQRQPQRGNCSTSAMRSPSACRPARTTTCGSPATRASRLTTIGLHTAPPGGVAQYSAGVAGGAGWLM